MATLVTTVNDVLRYRGKIGQWSWVFHRIAGLGTLLFFLIHVVDTSTSAWNPDLYAHAIGLYRQPIFGIGEIILVACVIYHGLNGLRITLLDLKPQWWKYQRQFEYAVVIGFVVLFIPAAILMFSNILAHPNG